jgi:hypothetical protein
MLAGNSLARTVTGIFAGSTPDPTAWNYNPNAESAESFFNATAEASRTFRYSSTAGRRR